MKTKLAAEILGLSLIAIACTHESDDYPVLRHETKERTSSAAPAPAPNHVQQVPLVTMPPPPAPRYTPPPVPPKTVAPAAATSAAKDSKPTAHASQAPDLGSGSNTLKLDEPLSPPVKRMLTQAEESLKKGKVMEARAQADRAYRMDLHDPRTTFMLARVAAHEKSYDDAEQWAMRSLENLNDPANKKVVWNFIARCREKSGNKKGVAAAKRL